jgi:D-inositol-3-phosphate glycosyltransferase
VVAAAVGGLTTVVDDGTTGVLVDGDDPREWAAHLDALIGNDQRRRDMGRAATRRARRFTWAEAAGRLRRVYADLATRTPVPC